MSLIDLGLIDIGSLFARSPDFDLSFTLNTSAPQNISWYSIAMSSSGQYMAATADGGRIYISSNFGSTFATATAPSNTWNSIAMSSSGQYMAAAASGVGIYVSSNYGTDWTITSAPSNLLWKSIAMSSSGEYMAAVVLGGGIYVSSGNGWSITSAPQNLNWTSVSMSSSGEYIAAVAYNSSIYLSSNSGTNWNTIPNSVSYWTSVSMSSSGQYIAATSGAYSAEIIFISSNFGSTFATATAPSNSWISIAMSSSGQYIAVTGTGVGIYISSNFGSTFATATAPSNTCISIAMSSTGQYMAACVYDGGGIYTNINLVSQITTNYLSNGVDLGSLFTPLTPSTSFTITSNYLSNGVDLGAMFAPYNSVIPNFSQNWTTGPLLSFIPFKLAMSRDGVCQLANVNGGKIYYLNSTNIWTLSNSLSQSWMEMAISDVTSNGYICLAVVHSATSGIYISTNSGVTWAASTPALSGSNQWWGVSISSDATTAFVVSSDNSTSSATGYVYSTRQTPYINNTSTWSQVPALPLAHWREVAMSSSGQYVVACIANGNTASYGNYYGIYYSTNYGATWNNVTSASGTSLNIYLYALTMSDSGQYAVSCTNTNLIIYSSDYCSTWLHVTFQSTVALTDISMSSSGQFVIASSNIGIYYSTNYGATWTYSLQTSGHSYSDVAISGNGVICNASLNSTTSKYIYSSISIMNPPITSGFNLKNWINITSGLQYDQFSNEIYTGIIFKSGTGTLSFTGIIPEISFVIVGGGGGGGNSTTNGVGFGGGGAGYFVSSQIQPTSDISITVGSKGFGGSSTPTGTTPTSGGNSILTYGSAIYKVFGGTAAAAAGSSTTSFAGGFYYGYGGIGGNSSSANGVSSYSESISIPVADNTSGYPNQTLMISGGGGNGAQGNTGGESGQGIGGIAGQNVSADGQDGFDYYTSGTYYAGGGGGGAAKSSSGSVNYYNGGNGSSGIVIIWWVKQTN
jgi:hypothetical protein